MLIKTAGAVLGLIFLAFVTLIVGVMQSCSQSGFESGQITPASFLSEQLSDGLIEAQMYLLGDLAYRSEVQFSPDSTSTIPPSMRPEVNLSMVSMHIDGYEPQLELVGSGAWRSQGARG